MVPLQDDLFYTAPTAAGGNPITVADCMDYQKVTELRLWREDPDAEIWGECAGTSDWSDRGIRCSMWQALHGLTVHAPDSFAEGEVSEIIKNMLVTYYGKFLGEDGRATIQSAYDNVSPFGTDDTDVLYTHKVHNQWNTQENGSEIFNLGGPRDPWYPKYEWPEASRCTQCASDNTVLTQYIESYYALSTTPDEDIDTALNAFA